MADLLERQASCFLNDAEEYRSINHRVDEIGLKVYNFFYSKYWNIVMVFIIVGLHCLAFLEFPSSLSVNSYLSINKTFANGTIDLSSITFPLEGVFLLIILIDSVFQVYFFGLDATKKNPWLLLLFVLMFVSWIDFFVSVGLKKVYFIRLRRFFRPIFALQKSQLMKKVIKSLSKTVADIFSVFVLLFLWLFMFTLISVSIFNGFDDKSFDSKYQSFYSAFYTLLVLLTTANHPDAMIIIYNHYRLAFIFFFIFMAIGIFVFMNVLIAIVFDEFRGHVLDSMQTSLSRRRVAMKAIYEVLCEKCKDETSRNTSEVEIETLKRVIKHSSISNWRKLEMIKAANSLGAVTVDWLNIKLIFASLDEQKESKKRFSIPNYKIKLLKDLQKVFLSKYFEIIGLLVCSLNVLAIAIEISNKFEDSTTQSRCLEITTWFFICLYLIEQFCKFFAMGWKLYFSKNGCRFEFLITILILAIKTSETTIWRTMSRKQLIFWRITIWDLPRITNLLVLIRAAGILLLFPSLTPIVKTLFDVPIRMKSVIGLLLLMFYIYALLGMNIFGRKLDVHFFNKTQACGTFQQLDYGAINFDDFYSSIVALWCLLIVNNWQAFMEAFEMAVDSKLVHIFMISWWIITVIVFMNCITAFVIETYTHVKSHYKKEKVNLTRPHGSIDAINDGTKYMRNDAFSNKAFTFQMLFKNDLIEPTEEDLQSPLRKCSFLCQYYPHIGRSY